jgi:serine/threonine-protein kinase
VCDAEVPTPAALFGRGLARLACDLFEAARSDFEAAMPTLRDACRLELAQLAIRLRTGLTTALADAEDVARTAEPKTQLAARAWHLTGVLQMRLSDNDAALESLTKAADAYQQLSDRLGNARVQDSIGMLHAEQGRLDCALQAYTVSLADKTIAGDMEGMAIALGNVGRAHLRAMRYQDALDCFGRDLEIATRLGQTKAQAQMHDHLAQALFGLKELDQAENEFSQCLALAAANNYHAVEFFAYKDRALLRIAQRRFDEAEADLNAAKERLLDDTEADLAIHLLAARGELLAARRHRGAADALEEAAAGYARLKVPDREIACRVLLAHTLVDTNQAADAERCLLEALKLATADGYGRYLRTVREALAGLGIVERAAQEQRPLVTTPSSEAPSAYLQRELLGKGAFGEVYRAMDLVHDREVAFKRLHLDRLYEVRERDLAWASARTELEAASRVWHPCVARVLAVGTEPQGTAYVVQEFVRGEPLSKMMPEDNSADVGEVLRCLQRVADGLSALHLADVVHRDLKPANIVIRQDKVPVLIDFGVAHVARFTERAMPDVLPGTFDYMAPEQAMGKSIDGRADLYALGVIAYQWLTGILPLRLRGDDFDAMTRDLVHRAPDPLRDFRPNVSPEAEALVMSLLEKKPRRRPANATVVARQLQEMATRV